MEKQNDSVKYENSRLVSYDSAARYWSQIPATIEGMLGGFGFISRTDIKGSQSFLQHLFMMNDPPGKDRAADCGAGIGRVTKNLLSKFFTTVDLVEQNEKFLEEAQSFVRAKHTVVNCFNVGLQDFSPELETYDVVWSQWVLGHLTNEDLVAFFRACKRGLKPNGVIVVKENITSSDSVEVDYEDSSVTRPLHLFTDLYRQAGLQCIYQQKQNNFPKGIYQVIMFALRPDQHASATDNSNFTVLDNHDNLSLDSESLNNIVVCDVDRGKTRSPEEEINKTTLSSDCSENDTNDLNPSKSDVISIHSMEKQYSSKSAENIAKVDSSLPIKDSLQEECKLQPSRLFLLPAEGVQMEHECLQSKEMEVKCQTLPTPNIHQDCKVPQLECAHQDCHKLPIGSVCDDSRNLPLDIQNQQELAFLPTGDSQLDCRNSSLQDVYLIEDIQKGYGNFPSQSIKLESPMLQGEEGSADLSGVVQEECRVTQIENLQLDCSDLLSVGHVITN